MTRTLLTALAAALLAGCAAPSPATSPSLGLDGLASDVTEPTGGFDATFGWALGPGGEVFASFTRDAAEWEDGVDPGEWGLALIHRDGTSDIIAEPGDPLLGDTSVSVAAVSNTTVAWGLLSYDVDPPNATHDALLFWDRVSREVTKGAETVTSGDEHDGVELSTLDFTLVEDTALWTQYATWDDGVFPVLVAATPDGRAWLPLGTTEDWRNAGLDLCASTVARPVFWIEHQSPNPDGGFVITIDHFTLDDAGMGSLVAGDEVVRSNGSDGYFLLLPKRCGNDLLGMPRGDRELDANGNLYFGITSLDDPYVAVVLPEEDGFSLPRTVLLTPSWIVLVLYNDSLFTTHIINRATGARHEFVGDRLCGDVSLQGEYVMWQEPRAALPGDSRLPAMLTCETHVGVMAP